MVKLYAQLQSKTEEAKSHEIEKLNSSKDLSQENLDSLRKEVENSFKLFVNVTGVNDEQSFGFDVSVFNEDKMPIKVKNIFFDSSTLFKIKSYNREPSNKLQILLDFTKSKLFDFSNPSDKPVSPISSIIVNGENETWVNGVYNILISFFKEKKKKRSWIHYQYSYEIVLWLFVLPLSFWTIFRADSFIKKIFMNIPSQLLVGIYIYIFFMVLLLCRLLFNYGKWVFPAFEYDNGKGTKMGAHRKVFYIIFWGLIVGLVGDIIRYVF
ncbi:MAG: hypothetical protein MUO85_01250 [candidate division Zixibacteria bacterium]|nr:hypothetical protein [candidate division Zixibacteria bacterium]